MRIATPSLLKILRQLRGRGESVVTVFKQLYAYWNIINVLQVIINIMQVLNNINNKHQSHI
jgi:hypothetical protein